MKRHLQDSLIHIFLTIGVILLISSNIYFFSELRNKNQEGTDKVRIEKTETVCDEDCKKEIASLVESKKEDSSPEPETTNIAPTISKTSSPAQTSYITLGTTGVSTNVDWENVAGSEVYLDLANDYAKEAIVSWEASLKVAHSNGTAFVRLYDDTNNIVVEGSELSVTDKEDFTFVTSKNLPVWSGRNLYKVQIKSLNSFEVTYTGGRIKIVH